MFVQAFSILSAKIDLKRPFWGILNLSLHENSHAPLPLKPPKISFFF